MMLRVLAFGTLAALLGACSDDTPTPAGSGGQTSGGSAGAATTGGTASGGTSSGGMSSGGSVSGSSSGGQASGGASGGGASGGSGGQASGGTGGSANGGTSSGGTSSGGSGGATGGSGGAPAGIEANVTLMPTSGNTVMGSVHFVQTGATVQATLTLTNCPTGMHAMHFHAVKDCGNNGEAAGAHWVPQGEGLGTVNCGANGMGTHAFMKTNGVWSIGDPASADILQHAFMLHQGDDANPGGRIACGIPAKAP